MSLTFNFFFLAAIQIVIKKNQRKKIRNMQSQRKKTRKSIEETIRRRSQKRMRNRKSGKAKNLV